MTSQDPAWLAELARVDAEGSGPDGYVLKESLGRGGMAEVYAAVKQGPSGFSKKVVVKSLLPEIMSQPSAVERFVREATLAGMFHHPHIVEILDLIREEDTYFIVMEFLDGYSLGKILKALSKPLPADDVAYLGCRIASALDYAHNFRNEEGENQVVVHRDVTPENIVVTSDGGVKLIDFGIAKDIGGADLTQADRVLGKPLYIPPESFRSSDPAPARDVYSLGMSLWVALSGRTPFKVEPGAEGFARLMVDIQREQIPSLSSVGVEAPKQLEYCLGRALNRQPNLRPTAADFRAELEQFLARRGSPGSEGLADLVRKVRRDSDEDSPAERGRHSLRRLTMSAMDTVSAAIPIPDAFPKTGESEIEPTLEETVPSPIRKESTVQTPSAPRVSTPRASPKPPAETAEWQKAARQKARSPIRKLAMVFGLIVVAAIAGLGFLLRPRSAPTLETPVDIPQEPEVQQTAPVDERGTLVVRCDSWRYVGVDGKQVGMCPEVEVKVLPGPHEVTVHKGKRSRKRLVEIRPRGLKEIDFRSKRSPRPKPGKSLQEIRTR